MTIAQFLTKNSVPTSVIVPELNGNKEYFIKWIKVFFITVFYTIIAIIFCVPCMLGGFIVGSAVSAARYGYNRGNV